MKIYNLKRFSRPDFLCRIEPRLLKMLLRKFENCVPAILVDGSIDYEFLAQILASPGGDADTELFDALALLDEVSDDRNFDSLVQLLADKPYAPESGNNASAADLALIIWLNEPELLEQVRTKNSRRQPRSFTYFKGIFEQKKYFVPLREPLIRKLTRTLNCVFQAKRRGRNVMVNVIDAADDEYHFMIRKGEPLKRDSSIKPDGETEQVFYRPERFDLVVLRPKIDEIRMAIHRKTAWIVDAYRTMFGYAFYGEREYFLDKDIFTLEPLMTEGTTALSCKDIQGMEEVSLEECKVENVEGGLHIMRGKGIFKWLVQFHLADDGSQVISAKFKVRFSHSKNERMVTVKSGNEVEFKFDDDGVLIEQWLVKRKFKNNG